MPCVLLVVFFHELPQQCTVHTESLTSLHILGEAWQDLRHTLFDLEEQCVLNTIVILIKSSLPDVNQEES